MNPLALVTSTLSLSNRQAPLPVWIVSASGHLCPDDVRPHRGNFCAYDEEASAFSGMTSTTFSPDLIFTQGAPDELVAASGRSIRLR
jgi:hypothetical protein